MCYSEKFTMASKRAFPSAQLKFGGLKEEPFLDQIFAEEPELVTGKDCSF